MCCTVDVQWFLGFSKTIYQLFLGFIKKILNLWVIPLSSRLLLAWIACCLVALAVIKSFVRFGFNCVMPYYLDSLSKKIIFVPSKAKFFQVRNLFSILFSINVALASDSIVGLFTVGICFDFSYYLLLFQLFRNELRLFIFWVFLLGFLPSIWFF